MSNQKRIPKEQVIAKLRELDFSFKRSGKNHDLWRKRGGTTYASVPRSATITEAHIRSMFGQIGLTAEEVNQFLKQCTY